MPMFPNSCKVGCYFKSWLQTTTEEGKMTIQADQTLCEMECTQNGCRLLFRIFEYVI